MAIRTGSGPSRGEINVTPLIDVLLVLLVIFLVATPIALRSEHVEVPTPDPSATPPATRSEQSEILAMLGEPVVAVAIHADLTYTIDDGAPIVASALAHAVVARLASARAVVVDADDGVAWRDVIATVDELVAIDGVERVALATKP